MFEAGLVSVTFRACTAEQIIKLCSENNIRNIEWGSDIHVRETDIGRAEEIQKKCEAEGIRCPSYGSYFRIGRSDPFSFSDYINTAKALGASTIRVWAYQKGSADISEVEYAKVVSEAKMICKMAEQEGITIALENHILTLTDEYSSAKKLLKDVDCKNFLMYWQPNQKKSIEYNRDSAKELSKYTTNIHVFNWTEKEKLPLSMGMQNWKEYLSFFNDDKTHVLYLEFMPDDSTESLQAESKALFDLICT